VTVKSGLFRGEDGKGRGGELWWKFQDEARAERQTERGRGEEAERVRMRFGHWPLGKWNNIGIWLFC
jgi:hypothetical protein